MFALPISMPRIKGIIFYQNNAKIKSFLQKKCEIFERWGSAFKPPVPLAGGALPADPQNSPHCEFLATRLANFVASRKNLKDIANRSDIIGIALS